MPISGLVVTFESAVTNHGKAIETMRAIEEIEVGIADGVKLAIVIDSATQQRDREIWNTVENLPGVLDLSVTMVAFDEPAGNVED